MKRESGIVTELEAAGIRFVNAGQVKWSFEGFDREVAVMRSWMVKNLQHENSLAHFRKQDYLLAQQVCIEHDFICALRPDFSRIGPYLDITLRKRQTTVRAKACFLYSFQGVLWRHDHPEERFNLPTIEAVLELMARELENPSLNFCTIFGADDFDPSRAELAQAPV